MGLCQQQLSEAINFITATIVLRWLTWKQPKCKHSFSYITANLVSATNNAEDLCRLVLWKYAC